MTIPPIRTLKTDRRALSLAVIILVQSSCATFFFGDVISDLFENGPRLKTHLIIEAIAAFALVAGIIFLMIELRRMLNRVETLNRGLRAARGEMSEVISLFFDEWALTPAEKDVAMMVLKGIDNETIARLRGTASGTVRAQCSQIYAKSNVDGRSQLMSLFVEELLSQEA
jgi:DNA-binding CsgD family transcriptional regulator